MKKISTPCRSVSSTTNQSVMNVNSEAKPRKLTLELIRQFARTYQAGPSKMAISMPGYSLN